MEVLFFLCILSVVITVIAMQTVLVSLKTMVGDIAETLERLAKRLDEMKSTVKEEPAVLSPRARYRLAAREASGVVSRAASQDASTQEAGVSIDDTDAAEAKRPFASASLVEDVPSRHETDEFVETEKEATDKKEVSEPVSRFIASGSTNRSDGVCVLEDERKTAEICVQMPSAASEKESAGEISIGNAANAVAESVQNAVAEPRAEDKAYDDAATAPILASAELAEEGGEPLVAAESSSSKRVKQLWNWLIYGRAAGCSSGEASEKLVATTWLLRLGILVIFCTAVFLLRLSIERGMLSPAGRLCLSFLTGACILCWGMSRRMRERYWALGQTLIGIGLGLFYFSSYAMTAMYHFVSPTTAGCVMLLVTLTAGVLSDRLNSIAIAMVAMVGGYATPLMLNTDSKNLIGLCFYLLLLVCGVLWLSYRRKWEQLVWLAMLFTYFIFYLGLAYKYQSSEFGVCMSFVTLYFMLFSTSVFLYNVRNAQEVTALEIISLVANSAIYLLLSMLLISHVCNGDRLYYAPLTLGMAFFYLAHAIFFARRKRDAEHNLLIAFCALCGVYLAMTAPIVLSGQWLGAAWALQGLLMLWLGVRIDSRFLRSCGWLLYILTLGRLCMDFYGYGFLYRETGYGDGFWSGVLARICQFGIPIACMAYSGKMVYDNTSTAALLKTSAAQTDQTALLTQLSGVVLNLAFSILIVFLLCECYVDFRFLNGAYRPFSLTVILTAGIALAFLAFRKNVPGFWFVTFVTVLLVLFSKCFIIDYIYGLMRRGRYDYFFTWNDSIGSLLNFATMLTVGHFLKKCLGADKRERELAMSCRIFWPILLFLFSTSELKVILHNTLPGLEVGGVSVLWAIFAFIAIFVGVSRGIRVVRYVGLGLFTVVVFKVFVFDLARLDPFWRVCAFLVFGILLIGAAFIYLKYWQSSDRKPKEDEK